MKQLILLLLASFSFIGTANSQSWNFIGGSAGYNAAEVDIAVSTGGVLYMGYIDTDNSNKVTVRKWNNGAWQLVGTAGIGTASAFDLQLVTTSDNNPAFVAKCMGSSYESFELFRWNGTTWVNNSIFGYAVTDHDYDLSLAVNSTGQEILTFYSEDEQSNNYPEGIVTVNMSSGTQVGDMIYNDPGNEEVSALSSYAGTGNDVRIAYGSVGMGFASYYAYLSGGVFNSVYFSDEAAEQIKIERNFTSANYSTVHRHTSGTSQLRFCAFNGTTPGTTLNFSNSNTVSDFDFDTQYNDAYVFYKSGTTCYYKKVTDVLTPVQSTMTSGTALAPANATSLASEVHYSNHLIAYVSSGKCFVKERNVYATIEDYDVLSMCEQTLYNDPWVMYILDENYDNSGLSIQINSQNTAIIPQSAITVLPAGNGTFGMQILTTNDVASQTIMDLQFIISDNGVNVDTMLLPITIYPKPAISFNFSNTTFCENATPVNLNNKATPFGGTWTGQGVQNNQFYPQYFNVSSEETIELHYTKTSVMGCTATSDIIVNIVPAPAVSVTMTEAECNENNGSASVTITEGQAPYDIYWSNGSTQSSVASLEAGQYHVTVSDANGCSTNSPVMIATDGVALSAATTNVLCNGAATGAINLTVTGGTGNLTYNWSNGATTQDLTNVQAGSYEVAVTDAEGCTSNASYTILQPQAILMEGLYVTSASCGEADGNAEIALTGGNQPFTYEWVDSQGDPVGNNSIIEDFAAGNYTVTATDNSGCMFSANVMITNIGGPVIAIDTIISASCSNDGEIIITNIDGDAVSYEWSHGPVTQNVNGLASGTYIVTALNEEGCASLLEAVVQPTTPDFVEICLLTVDTLNNTNLVVWEKPVTNGIDHFNIYRETSQAGVYQLAGSVDYDDESIYNDPVASPSVRSWRYKIASVDDCGTESEMSEHHKTIHLTINLGLGDDINLSWDTYEGFAFDEFVIKRHTDLDDWTTIQTMPTNLFSYTDTPPTTEGLLYIVTIDSPETCSSTKSAQDFNSSRSNKDNRLSTTPGEASLQELLDAGVNVYPNPASGSVQIENQLGQTLKLSVFDQTGRLMEELEIQQGKASHDLSYLTSGVYQLRFTVGGITTVKKLTVQN